MRPSIAVPSAANLRYFRRLVWFSLGAALIAFAAGAIAMSMGGGGGRRSPMSMLVLGLGLIASTVRWRSTISRLEDQIRQLGSYGRRFPVSQARTEQMDPGFRSGGLYVVVARWRAADGQEHEALSEGFDYDPALLLERERIEVLADPFHPDLCLVAPDSLPARRYRELGSDRRALASKATRLPLLSRSVSPWIPLGLLAIVIAILLWMVR